MKYDRVEFHSDTGGKSRITLHFNDIDHKLAQHDNLVTRTVEMSMQEWAKFVTEVEKVSGIADMITALEGKS